MTDYGDLIERLREAAKPYTDESGLKVPNIYDEAADALTSEECLRCNMLLRLKDICRVYGKPTIHDAEALK